MADFCYQCTEAFLMKDGTSNDFVGLQTLSDDEAGLGVPVLCVGCGMTLVDSMGRCIADCMEHHGPQPPG